MTPAQKSPLFNALFWRYIRRLLKRQFGRIIYRPCSFALDRPTIYIANHHTWWDGFFAFALNELHFHQRLHLMMGAEQFANFRFFRKLGVFSVDQADPSDVVSAFRYSVRILTQTKSPSLWIFPAGEMLPAGSPVHYRDGFARIARAATGVHIVPVAFWSGFTEGQYPDVVLEPGEAITCEGRSAEELFARGTSALDQLVARLERRIVEGDLGEFRVLLKGRSSVSHRFARFSGAQ